MVDLVASFEAAFVGVSPPRRQTPMPRIPPKQPPPVVGRSNSTTVRGLPLRAMGNKHLRDVTNDANLGIVLASRILGGNKIRIKTTLTTVDVCDDRVVRGRIHKRSLYGVRVSHVDPFA